MTVRGIALQFILLSGLLTLQTLSFTGTDTSTGKLLDQKSRNTDKQQYLSKHWTYIINSVRPSAPVSSNNTLAKTNSVLVETGTNFGLFLRKFAVLELGMQETKTAYESVSFDSKQSKEPLEQVLNLASKLTAEMTVYQDALDRMVSAAKLSYEADGLDGTLPLCCDISLQSFRFDDYYKTLVSTSLPCWTRPIGQKKIFVPGKAFGDVLLDNNDRLPNLKWQYFVSPDGVQVQFPSSKQNCPKDTENRKTGKPTPERKSWLIQKSSSDSQIHKIIFVIQLDENTDAFIIKSIKNIVFQLLKLLDESDEVGIISSESDQLWSNFICDQMLKTSSWTRFQIINYIAYLENRYKATSAPRSSVNANESFDDDSAKPDHYAGLKKAISMACQNSSESSNMFPPCATTIIQLSSSGIDINKFHSKTLNVNCPVFIESLFLKPYNQTEQEIFRRAMQNVASKNIWRVQVFSVEQTDPTAFAEKVALQLNTKKEWWSFSDILSQFLPLENNYSQNQREFSLPHWNPISKELVIVAKRFVFHNGRPLGLSSVEIPLLAFTQHLSTFDDDGNIVDPRNYVFLIDKNGKIIMHPAFGKPEQSRGLFSSVSIEQVEVYKGFPSLKKRLLSEKSGCASLHSDSDDIWITYTWANSFNYVIVLTLFGDNGGCSPARHEFVLRKNALSTNEIQHHLLLDKNVCCRNQLVSLTKAGLYLAPSAFVRPADMNRDESKLNFKRLLSLMAFIGDHSGMIQNPRGELKPSVKHHIGVLAPSVQIWKQRYLQSDWNKYVLRRFASGGAGAFLLTYPGLRISSGYVPSSTKWYTEAVSGEGKLIFLQPKFDKQAGVPVVTMSQAISVDLKTPFSRVLHKTPVAIAGADLHAGFLQKLLEDLLPECSNQSSQKTDKSSNATFTGSGHTRCFLVDESGFVIYHPHLAGSVHKTSEVHLTQVEPLSVIDILQQSQINKSRLKKYMCHKISETSVTQGSLKRMYKFLLSASGISKQHGEPCNTYFIVPVPETNLILGVVRENCSSATAFCPCSRVDNLCLNCLRMEQSDCECPCECPREPSFCTRKGFEDLPENIVPCEFPSEDLPMVAADAGERCQENGSQSFRNFSCDYVKGSCSSITEAALCKGSWDCEWCQLNSTLPRCSTYSDCYDLKDEKTPLKEMVTLDDGSALDKDNHSAKHDSQITMVPVLVVLSVFIVFIALVIYCYRHRALTVSESQPNLFLLPLQDNVVGVASPAAPDQGESDSDADNVRLVVPVARVRRRQAPPAIPPPRSPVGSSVDLGYSTMTETVSECGAGPGPYLGNVIPLPRARPSIAVAVDGKTQRNHRAEVNTTTDDAVDRQQVLLPQLIND